MTRQKKSVYKLGNSEDKGESSSEISCSNKDAEVEGSLTQLKEENEMLKAQIDHYGNLGVHDPTKAKVIHFRDILWSKFLLKLSRR
ncbi:hypothetical protein Avbf_14487 [Armadillidium vulgare]|nr:hypothetical protein Avbf_14487 [Armadillidium vulgare]